MFDVYKNRLSTYGANNREALKNQSIIAKETSFKDSQFYKEVRINNVVYDSILYEDVSDTVKSGFGNFKIEFKHDVHFDPGTYVDIYDNEGNLEHWLIMNDIGIPFFPKNLIKKCNYELKWKNADGKVVSRWCIIDDSYKMYSAFNVYDNTTKLPTATIVAWLPQDSETINLRRDKRFLIDVPNVIENPDCYEVTNRNVVTKSLKNNTGLVVLALYQSQYNPTYDNKELMIADFYSVPTEQTPETATGTYGEFTYKGKPQITMGTPAKKFTLVFKNGNETLSDNGNISVAILPEFAEKISYSITNNVISISCVNYPAMINYSFKVTGKSSDSTITTELMVKVVSGI